MIPKPFKRPSIEIGTRITRRWVDTEADQLSVGDIVQDHGLVTAIYPVAPASSGMVKVEFSSGQVFITSRVEVVRAFTEGASVGHTE